MRPDAALPLALAVLVAFAPPAAAGASRPGVTVSYQAAAGYDTYVQTFPLADVDTTETISEFDLTLGAEARAPGGGRHRWWARPEVSLGTELARERLELGWQLRPDSVAATLRVEARWHARQYRARTDYALSSDGHEGRLEARGVLSPRGARALEGRLHGAYASYARPSDLELDQREIGGALLWRSGHDAERYFSLGPRLSRRAYPDSAAIDRTVCALEGEFDSFGLAATGARGWLHAERRTVRDEAARPCAWAGWATLEGLLACGPGRIEGRLEAELWDYDDERSAWFDSWRVGGALLWRGGEPGWGRSWQAGLAAERLDAGSDSPETYTQAGVRAGVETAAERLVGSLVAEVGRRDYAYAPPEPGPDLSSQAGSRLDLLPLYTDFVYWRLWLCASWRLGERFSVDAAAHYEPERHTEDRDDASVAFGSVRAVWRW